jgi:hypothetical protein
VLLTWENDVVESFSQTGSRSTLQADDLTGWSDDFRVEVGGRRVVSHAGAVGLRVLADRSGQTRALSAAASSRFMTVGGR